MSAPVSSWGDLPTTAERLAAYNAAQEALDVVDNGFDAIAYITRQQAKFDRLHARIKSGEISDPRELARIRDDLLEFMARKGKITDHWRREREAADRHRAGRYPR